MKVVIVILIALVFVGFGGGYYFGSEVARTGLRAEISDKDQQISTLAGKVGELNMQLANTPSQDSYNKLRDDYNSLVNQYNARSNQRTSVNCFSNTYISGTFTNCY